MDMRRKDCRENLFYDRKDEERERVRGDHPAVKNKKTAATGWYEIQTSTQKVE